MIEQLFSSLQEQFIPGVVSDPVSYYFSLDDCKKTVRLSGQECVVEHGKMLDNADCVCKTSPEFFLKIWEEGYRPGIGDFLSGAIKSNNPEALRVFLKAFGKKS